MNTNGTNPGMNVDDYENLAVQKSNTAKRVAAGAAIFAGGAAVAGGAAYAAGHTGATPDTEIPLTADDVKEGADVASTYQDEVHETKHVVHEEKHVVQEQQQETPQEEEPVWEETTELYVDGEKVASVEKGSYKGHSFELADLDGDNHADYLAYDVDGDGRYSIDEIQTFEKSDHVHMGHTTAHMTKEHVHTGHYSAYHSSNSDEPIYNDYSDEKAGESYSNDLAENNPDYNSDADADNYQAAIDNEYQPDGGYGEEYIS